MVGHQKSQNQYTGNAKALVKVTGPTALELKKLISLNLCYLGLYHRKSILSFSTFRLKEICTRKVRISECSYN